MPFNNSELNRARSGWQKDRETSEPTDPDYAENSERRYLEALLSLSDTEQQLALEGFPPKKRKELAAELDRMKQSRM